MKLNFIKVNPTENMTVFVVDSLPREKYFEIANNIMNYNNINAEQVGFIERPENPESEASIRLQMMGGEFCGNASRALAAVAVQRGYMNITEKDGKYQVPLEASGIEGLIHCQVEQKSSNGYEVSLEMPLHKSISTIDLEYKNRAYKGTIVDLPGISHAVFFTDDKSLGEDFFGAFRSTIKDFNYDAFGIMFYDEKEEFMRPLVYVKDTDSLIWERSCGTGTVALGVVLSYLGKQSVDKNVNQPGGQMQITTVWKEHELESIILKGMVYIVAEGEVYI
jgi:histidine racemase